MLNHITIMGRLVRDPELRRTGIGIAVANFTVACDRDFAQDGNKETDFIDCVVWRQTAEFVSKYFQKGSMIVVSGRLESRKWTDKDGNKRTSWEVRGDNVYFGGTKKDSDSGGNGGSYGGYNNQGYGSGNGYSAGGYNTPVPQYVQGDFAEIDDDEPLPF